jgi:hypothetical protein
MCFISMIFMSCGVECCAMSRWLYLDPELRVEWLEQIVKEACRKKFEDDKGEKRAIGWSEDWLAKP